MGDASGIVPGKPTNRTGTLTRRELLASSALVGASTLPLQLASAAQAHAGMRNANSGESLALARYVASIRFEDLPARVVDMTSRSILDAIGVSLAASGLEPACRPYLDLALESGSPRGSSVLGTGRAAPVLLAALANGSLAHAMDYEDAHEETRTHPNAAAIAAALSLSEDRGASGRDLIVAVALGADIVCRLARALIEDGAPPPGFYQPAIVGTFGATTAAARLLGLTAEQIVDAWSLALCQNSCSAELQNSPESTVRAIREGPCARVGVESALLAARGVRGFPAPFEGESGFFVMYAAGVQRRTLLDDLGKAFAGAAVSFKAWPSCRDTHIYVQAALELLAEHRIEPRDIAAVSVAVTPQNMIVCEPAELKRRPQTAIAAKFSLYFTLAAALIDRRIDFGSYSADALRRVDILSLAENVSYRNVPKIERGEVLEVRMRDGTVHRKGVDAVYGSPAAPLPDEVLVTKFVDCGARAMRPRTPVQLRRIADQLLTLERIRDVREVMRQI